MEEQEIHLRDYYRVIRKRKNTVLLFFLVTLTGVVLGTFSTTPVYQATTQVLVEKNESIPLMGNVYYNPYDPEFFATQEQLIKSQNVCRKVVQLLDLENTYETYFPDAKEKKSSFIRTTVQGVKKWIKGLFPSNEKEQATDSTLTERSRADILADFIQQGITVTPVKESRVINISFQSENPLFATLVANTIAKAYQEEVMAIQMHASGYAQQWMTKKAEEEKEKLARAEKRLQQYMQKNDIVTVEDRITIVPQRLADVTRKLSENQEKRKSLESIYNQIIELQKNKGDLETLPVISENKELQAMREQLREAERHVQELRQKYGYKHPVMIEARANVAELRKKKEMEVKKIVASVKNQYENALAQEEIASNSLKQVKQSALLLNEKMTEYNILKRDVDSIKALYNALLMRIKEKGVSEKSLKVNVWTTQKAEVPEKPIKPKKKRNILLGMLLGLFGGVGLAFFLEYLDNTVSDPEEAERRLKAPVLGVLQKMPKGTNTDTLLQDEPTSPWAEGFKLIRTALLLSRAENAPRIILITSMAPKEGKTTTSINLAMSLAQTGRSVLLVDADMRKPRLHKALGLSNTIGLSQMLTGQAEMETVIQDSKSGVSLLTAGPTPPNPAELLGSEIFSQQLERLRAQYDYIVFDSPPVFSATDSLVISSLVDGVVLVVSAGETSYDAVSKGIKNILSVGGKILGLVLNKMDVGQGEMEYYSYYGYYKESYKED